MRRVAFAAWAGLATMALVGCGGSGGSSTTATDLVGSATLSITWPTESRLIPVASNAITVSFLSGSSVVQSQTVSRPSTGTTSTVTFSDLPAETLTLKAQAFPNSDGTGTAQASGSKTVTIVADQNTEVSLTMDSTISSLSATPSSVSVEVGKTSQVALAALNSSGATVLVSDSTVSYLSANTAVATVSSSGLVTGVAKGSTTITVTESESGKTVSVPVTITGGTGTSTVIVN